MKLERLGKVLRVLSDRVRLRILNLLNHVDELCVCDIQECLRMPQYAVSRHLKPLKDLGMVSTRRNGKWVYHRLDVLDKEIEAIVHSLLQLVSKDPVAVQDLKRLELRRELGKDSISKYLTKNSKPHRRFHELSRSPRHDILVGGLLCGHPARRSLYHQKICSEIAGQNGVE